MLKEYVNSDRGRNTIIVVSILLTSVILVLFVFTLLFFAPLAVRLLLFTILMIAMSVFIINFTDRQYAKAQTKYSQQAALLLNIPPKPTRSPEIGDFEYFERRPVFVLLPYGALVTITLLTVVWAWVEQWPVSTANLGLLLCAVSCIPLLVFDRRNMRTRKDIPFTYFLCLLFAVAIAVIWIFLQPAWILTAQIVVVIVVTAIKCYLFLHTWIIANKTTIVYHIDTPFGSDNPPIKIKSADAPDISENVFDKILGTATLTLDTASTESDRWKPLRWVKHPDRLRKVFDLPTSTEIAFAKRNRRSAEKSLRATKRK